MRCRQVKERLDNHLAGTLPAAEARQVNAHLARCSTCLMEWRRLQAVETLLNDSKPLSAPASLTHHIMAAVAEQQRQEQVLASARSAPPPPSYWRAVWLGALLAILATLVVIVVIAMQPSIAVQAFNGVPTAMTTTSKVLYLMQQIGSVLVQNPLLLVATCVIYAGAVGIWLRLMRHAPDHHR